ncbi:hypothetical protein PSH97_21780 [Pseudomonas cucumis]|uniref:Uncharacterized protein n=1 Tax=Pseudomonas cucumis TaxID=2954082 RepID=A0ABY9ESJ6_9PSED|nr:hypothetical protein [Pseudomonas cucumis]WLG83705.1 hypothetical protein PSH97_21780 [Pseudomonas cucumis]
MQIRTFTPRPLLSALTCALAIGVLPDTSHAGLLGFDVTAGIDKGTLEFLRQFPTDVRANFVLAVRQSLDRTDLSVNNFFDHTDKLLINAQDALNCASIDLSSIPKDALDRLIGKDGNPAETLNDELESTREGAKWDTTPSHFRIRYADLDFKASVARCKSSSGDLVRSEIVKVRGQATAAYILWARLDGQCTSSGNCYELVSNSLKETLASSLKQDKDKIAADQRFARVTSPPKPGGWFNKYKWEPYQTTLVDLLRINDELALVTNDRVTKGKAAFDTFTASMNDINAKLADAGRKVRSNRPIDKVRGCNIGYNLVTQINGVESQLAKVKGYEVLTTEQMVQQKKGLADAKTTAQGYAKTKGGFIRNNNSTCEFFYPPRPFPGGRIGVF